MVSRRQIPGPRQQGMSLVEIMVALALGAFITVGIIQMFTANRTTYDVNMGQARMQENARFAMEFLAAPIRMAGFTGCSSRAELFNAVNLDADGQPYSEFDMSDPITGHAATGPNSWTPPLSELPDDLDTAVIAPGTDVLIVKSVTGDGLRLAQDMPNSSANIFTVIPDNPTDPGFDDGQVLMISDCSRATVFMITETTVTTGGASFRITHNTGASVDIGNSTQRLAPDDVGFRRDAAVYMLNTEYFFIAPGAGTNNRGDVPLSLWRKRGRSPAVELVEGVESLEVFYGEDTNNDRSPNRYRRIHEVTDRDRIVTARVTVRATSVDEVVEQGDGLLRRDFTKTIALRNRI